MKKTSAKKTSFTLAEAAARLKVSRQAVHKAIKEGRLKAKQRRVIKIEYEIPAESLQAYRVSDLHQSAGKKISNG